MESSANPLRKIFSWAVHAALIILVFLPLFVLSLRLFGDPKQGISPFLLFGDIIVAGVIASGLLIVLSRRFAVFREYVQSWSWSQKE